MRRLFLALILFSASCAFAQTPNMGISEPTVGVTVGPTWAQMINSALDVIDAHDHTSGKGARITPSAININGDLTFAGYQATNLKTSAYQSQGGTLASSFTGSLYNVGGNLYWNNGSGAAVQVTNGTAVNNPITGAFAATVPGAYPYTVSAGDAQKVLLVDTSSARTINLPAATTAVFFAIKDSTGSGGTNAITLVRAGSDTIDGVSGNRTLKTNFGWWFVISNGTAGWNIAEAMPGAIPSNGQIPIGNGNGYTVAALTGTSNQVTVTNGAGSVTLATPQNIHSGASPTFAGMNLSGLTASSLVATDGSKNLTSSVSSLSPTFAGETLSSNLTLSASIGKVVSNTSDASDNKVNCFAGGGDTSTTRGAIMCTYGNEEATAGYAYITAGNTSSASSILDLLAPGSNGAVNISTVGATRWTVDNAGNLSGNATNGADIVFAKAGTGVDEAVSSSVTAAGTNLATATLLTNRFSLVTTVAAGTGVALPATIPVGGLYWVRNLGANSLAIYANTGHTIDGAASVSVLPASIQNASVAILGVSSTTWRVIMWSNQ